MTLGVVTAYLVSYLMGLPEHIWAVMSALIAMRPNRASTFDAAWDRIRGTLLGVACGLIGVALSKVGVAVLVSTLGFVALLAYVSATLPTLRSAPVAALIILSSAEVPGHDTLQVAFLRVIQVAIGIGATVIVADLSSRFRADDRLKTGCARLLQGTAARMAGWNAKTRPLEPDAERIGQATREALARLTRLARGADTPSRLSRPAVPASSAEYHQRIAVLTGQVVQDVSMLNRIMSAANRITNDATKREAVAIIASSAIANVASVIEGKADAELDRLQELAGSCLAMSDADLAGHAQAAPFAGPLYLLAQDLRQLCQCVRDGCTHPPTQDRPSISASSAL
jgi:uncharacterized membrane protein YccC